MIIVSESSAEVTLRVRTERCATVRSRSSAAHNDSPGHADAQPISVHTNAPGARLRPWDVPRIVLRHHPAKQIQQTRPRSMSGRVAGRPLGPNDHPHRLGSGPVVMGQPSAASNAVSAAFSLATFGLVERSARSTVSILSSILVHSAPFFGFRRA